MLELSGSLTILLLLSGMFMELSSPSTAPGLGGGNEISCQQCLCPTWWRLWGAAILISHLLLLVVYYFFPYLFCCCSVLLWLSVETVVKLNIFKNYSLHNNLWFINIHAHIRYLYIFNIEWIFLFWFVIYLITFLLSNVALRYTSQIIYSWR